MAESVDPRLFYRSCAAARSDTWGHINLEVLDTIHSSVNWPIVDLVTTSVRLVVLDQAALHV